MESSNCHSRADYVFLATVAEEAERFDEMISAMKHVAKMNVELTVEERNLLSVRRQKSSSTTLNRCFSNDGCRRRTRVPSLDSSSRGGVFLHWIRTRTRLMRGLMNTR